MSKDHWYWRHRKGEPQELDPDLNGEVIIIKPAKPKKEQHSEGRN